MYYLKYLIRNFYQFYVYMSISVKPKNVDYLYVTTLSCCCVRLEWMHSRRYREKMFVISVNSTWNDNKVRYKITLMSTILQCNNYTLFGILLPSFYYTVPVQFI